MPHNRKLSRPVILGIVGDSASGKTTLASGVSAILGRDRVTILCSDDYHRLSRAVEDLLWSLIPEAHPLRDHAQLGRIVDEHNQAGISHPLALSQLLVTYHLVKAALGHTVV